ncbi:hypothetical protein PtA15_11A465 [Puccinia triticina]|uniref:Uncharacterized protein n=1 Tax=Puccinia triticina TaxID=208348 RepID=A0ABY7CWU1_9BASI|nr:uncharacterized protein PtA15_11A465 [Puccinia triticina]WAQ89774.1 hypothetical protein PtA15_11A465 [Puccinia triticina]
MGYVKYVAKVKTIVVKLLLQGKSRDDINAIVDENISSKSLSRWKNMFIQTHLVVRDASLYEPCGRPLAISVEEQDFILDIIGVDPTLYLDEIQKAVLESSGELYAISTIHDDLRRRLGLTLKVAQHVSPSQDSVKRARWTIRIANMPPEYLVFVGLHLAKSSLGLSARKQFYCPKGLQVLSANRMSMPN